MRKRLLAALIALVMVIGLVPGTALAADAEGTSGQGYFAFKYENGGTNKRTITVNLYAPDQEQPLDTLTVNDARSRNVDYEIALTDVNGTKDKYDIESVEIDGGTVTIPRLHKDSYEFRMDLEIVQSSTINVYLCPQFKEPVIEDGVIDAPTIYYRVTQASLLKLLHDNGVTVTADTKITDQQAVWAHFVEPYGTSTEWGFDEKPAGGNNLQYYWISEGLSNVGGRGNPNNIRYIEITYQQGNGPEQKQKIYSDNLKYINVGNSTYEIESNKNLDEHIVIFYTEGTTPDHGVWTPLDVRFVKTGQTVATSEAKMPTADTYTDRYFVAWTQQHNGGLPVLYNTLVKDDLLVFPQYKLWTTDDSTEIRVMNNDDLLQMRVAELLECSVDEIDWNSMKITVHGQGGAATNPNYGTPGGIHNDWNDEEDKDFYKVYNYRTGAEGTAYENKPIPVDEITSISVSVRKVGETDYEKSVEIEKGTFAGDFAISMGGLSGDWRVELYINAEGDYPENPNPDPAITDFTKTLVASAQAATDAGITATDYTFPENNKVIIPYGKEVTLLYAIKVTGTAGTNFTVTDEGATLVTTTAGVSGSDGTFNGSIPDNATEITFYVSKTFKAEDITEDGKLTNKAELTGENAPEEGGEATEEVDAEEESYKVYTYVQFVKEGNAPLTPEEKTAIEEKYGAELNSENYLAIGTFEIPMPDPTKQPYAPKPDGQGGENFFNQTLWNDIVNDITEENFTPETGIQNIDLDEIAWFKLSTAHGATDYGVPTTTYCWHLDGQIQLYAPDIDVAKELTSVQRDGEPITENLTGMTLEVGDVLTWTITVTNSGNADAEGLTLTDTLVAVGENNQETSLTAEVKDGDGNAVDSDDTFSVEKNSTVTFTATYVVTDADKGLTLSNTATVSDGDDETEDPSGETDNPVAERKVSIEKTLTEVNDDPYTEGNMVEVGNELTYEIKVTNTGNVALENVVVEDTLTVDDTPVTEGVSLSCTDTDVKIEGTTATIENLAVGGTVTITATYTVKEADAEKKIVNTAAVSGDGLDDGTKDEEDVIVSNPAVKVEKELTSATRGTETVCDGSADSLANYKAQVGDVLSYTITVTNEGNTELTDVKVTDSLWKEGTNLTIKVGTTETPAIADANGSYTLAKGDVIEPKGIVTITYTYTVQDSDVEAGEIKNTAGVYLLGGDEPGNDPDDTDEVTVNMDEDAYTITIEPADIVIYTGGTGYIGVTTNDNGDLLGTATESGLPQPGYHIELSEEVKTWLKDHGKDTEAAAVNLAEILEFSYDYNHETRSWAMTQAGIYDADAETGAPTRYVYTLDAAQVGDETIPVRILYFVDSNNNQTCDDGEAIEDDQIDMTADAAHADYLMTINPGKLDQSQIKAVFTTEDGSSITCNVNIGTGELTVKSVADENPVTNAIAANGDVVADGTLAAVDNGNVDFYVNDSQVTVDSTRVGLLVDSVSNSAEFDGELEDHAVEQVNAQDGVSLSDPQTESYYLDLVDTQNGNAVVTMGKDDKLTIYWPMPADADPNGDFYIVHYTGMDRENTVTAGNFGETVTINATPDGDHLTFTTDSFSPFVLVYEKKADIPPYIPPTEDPDPEPTPDPDLEHDPDGLNTDDHVSYLIGYEDGTVRPEADITRAEVATIFFRLLEDKVRDANWSTTSGFPDVNTGDWFNTAVSTLTGMGKIIGYEDGTFRPNEPITRAEFVTIATRFYNHTAKYEPDTFPDVDADAWYADYIQAAVDMELILGDDDGTFRPNAPITRAEAAAIVNRMLGRRPHEDHLLDEDVMNMWPDNSQYAWYYEDIQEATNSHTYSWTVEKDESGKYRTVEDWTAKLDDPDWVEIEQGWAAAKR